MYKNARIFIFLVISLGIATAPILINRGQVEAQPTLSLETPAIERDADGRCVESAEFMRAEHMLLLDEWRNAVVREGKTNYVSSDGRIFEMSLDNNCLKCHSDREKFCDSCHSYAAVEPYCWDCHDVAHANVAE
ncbi:MAG: sulfate reduction electron transfer complex DsrMKJOP subunit DsrJ [Coriobacteriales bacterium]|jgi:hypothetical protein|nr:sulfate reduction electron transfer complex DsrMKJOP subunit DsrJ [Coriobacteriales bacterium]